MPGAQIQHWFYLKAFYMSFRGQWSLWVQSVRLPAGVQVWHWPCARWGSVSQTGSSQNVWLWLSLLWRGFAVNFLESCQVICMTALSFDDTIGRRNKKDTWEELFFQEDSLCRHPYCALILFLFQEMGRKFVNGPNTPEVKGRANGKINSSYEGGPVNKK